MQGRNILNEKIQSEIYSLSKGTLLQAQSFLVTFHQSAEYQQLIDTKMSELCNEDVICLALARKPLDTDKIDIIKLKNAILAVYIKHFGTDTHTKKIFEKLKDAPTSEVYQLCNAISMLSDNTDTHGLKAAAFVLIAINHSRKVFPEIKTTELFCTLRMSGGYINLARLDFANTNLDLINLSDADLTGCNLFRTRFSSLDRARLAGANLSQADLTFTSLRQTQLDLAQCKDTNSSYSSIHFFKLSEFDSNILIRLLDHVSNQELNREAHPAIFKSIVMGIELCLNEISAHPIEKKHLIDTALNHPLFAKKPYTFANFIQYLGNAKPCACRNDSAMAAFDSRQYLLDIKNNISNKIVTARHVAKRTVSRRF